MTGSVISHYKILEKLGGGGMGVVYKAEDTKLDRLVALKFLPPELTRDPDAKHRFIHEAKAASALQHNNICTIHDIDESEDGRMYICMDFYDGETLKKKIERGPVPAGQAIEIAVQIAGGLAAAHMAGEIHRDIKPANIMITGRGDIKIVDFGLARLAGQTRLTQEGRTLGTVAYMSPEQAFGKETDRRTDIWSLGVVLFEMITGQVPFTGEYDNAVLYAVINETPPPVTGLRSGIPLELERIINKCLEKDPANRYQHADELIVDLRKLQRAPASIPLNSANAHAFPPAARKKADYRRLAVIIAAISVILVAGYFGISRLLRPAAGEEIKSIAVLPFDDMSPGKDQEYFCIGMTEQITTNLSRLQNLRVRGRNSVMKFINTSKTIPEIARELNVGYLLEGSIRKIEHRVRVTVQLIKTDDDYHVWATDYDRELDDILDVQDDIARNITNVLQTRLSDEEHEKMRTKRPVSTEAYEYYMKGKYAHQIFLWAGKNEDFAGSEKMLKKVIELDPQYTPAYTELADLYNTYYFWKAKTDVEKEKYMKLQEHYLRIAIDMDSSSADIWRVLGAVYEAKDDDMLAFQYTKKSVVLEPSNPANNIEFGFFFWTKGLYDNALKYYLRTIEEDPLDPSANYNTALIYWNIGQLEMAEVYFQKTLELDPDDALTLWYYSRLLYDLKKYARFRDAARRLEKVDTNAVHIKYVQALQYLIGDDKEKALHTYIKPDLSIGPDFLKMRFYDHFRMDNEFVQYLNEVFEWNEKHEMTWYLWLERSPLFDNLRTTPGFREILGKHKQLYEANLKKYPDIGS